VVNILGGLTLATRPRTTFASGLARSMLVGGAAQTVASLAALDEVQREDATLSTASADALSEAEARYTRSADVAATLGAVLAILGVVLGLLGRRSARTRGRGLGLLTQGSFLLTLASTDRWLRRRR
jgi:hypothetical protein